MKVIVLMALTLDGRIGKSRDHFPDWTGKADKRLFVTLTKRAGALIMGSRTFDTIGTPLPGRKNIVMTRNRDRKSLFQSYARRGFIQEGKESLYSDPTYHYGFSRQRIS